MRKNKLTAYGKSIKQKLLDMDKTQNWLISKINERSSIKMTSSYLNRIMIGKVADSSAVPIINDILNIKDS